MKDSITQFLPALCLNYLSGIIAINRSFHRHLQNREKNRYCDVVCYESSRVHLRPLSLQVTVPESAIKVPKLAVNPRLNSSSVPSSSALHRTQSAPVAAKDLVRNYIHANWVDGYRQKNAFICTQGKSLCMRVYIGYIRQFVQFIVYH